MLIPVLECWAQTKLNKFTFYFTGVYIFAEIWSNSILVLASYSYVLVMGGSLFDSLINISILAHTAK